MYVDYQKYALDQIKKHNKSMLIWYRGSGKSDMIVESIIDYTSNNHHKNIFIYVKDQRASREMLNLLGKKLKLPKSLSKIVYLNSCSIRVNHIETFEGVDVDFVIYDDFEYLKNVDGFSNLINKSGAKVLLVSSQYTTEVITYLDRDGDYYLNIVSYSSISSKLNERIDMYPSKGAYNVSNEYGNIQELYDGLGIKKERNLIDVWGLKIQRRKKLEEITKKINENI